MSASAEALASSAAPQLSLERPPLVRLLLRHEWRLTMRDFTSRSAGRGPSAKARKTLGRKRLLFNVVLAIVFMHLIGAIAILAPRHWQDTTPMRLFALGALAVLFTMMLSATMSRVVAAFHERRDLDLLLAAPIPPLVILYVRAITVVVAVTALFAVFLYPVANMGVISGHWWLARIYALVPVAAIASTGIALFATGAIVRAVGIRRARIGLQVLSAVIGASVYLISQGQRLLPDSLRHQAMAWLVHVSDPASSPWPIAFIVCIASGDPLAWIVFIGASLGVFGLSLRFASRRFYDVAQTPESDSPTARVERPTFDRRIARGFARPLFTTLLFKEWRLILRSPQLISQILLQVLYLMPLVLLSFGHETRSATGFTWGNAPLAAGVVGVAGSLAASLAWLTVSADDAPDLIAGSPRSRTAILSAKLVAAALPPIAVVTVIAVRMEATSVRVALAIWTFTVLACLCAAVLAVAVPASGKRSDFQRRHQGRGFAGFVEAFQFVMWGTAAGAAAGGYWIVCAIATVVALIMPAIQLPRALRNATAA